MTSHAIHTLGCESGQANRLDVESPNLPSAWLAVTGRSRITILPHCMNLVKFKECPPQENHGSVYTRERHARD